MGIGANDMTELETLKSELESAGWHVGKKLFHDDSERCHWYAWNPTRPTDWPDCECNDKPPAISLHPSSFEINGATHSGVQFELCGELHGRWHKLKMYSVSLDESIEAIPSATAFLGAAWKAIAALEQTT